MVIGTNITEDMPNQPIPIHLLLVILYDFVQCVFLAKLWHHVDYQEVQCCNWWFQGLVLIQSAASLSNNPQIIKYLDIHWVIWFAIKPHIAIECRVFKKRYKSTIYHEPTITPGRTRHFLSPSFCSLSGFIRTPSRCWAMESLWAHSLQDSVGHQLDSSIPHPTQRATFMVLAAFP